MALFYAVVIYVSKYLVERNEILTQSVCMYAYTFIDNS